MGPAPSHSAYNLRFVFDATRYAGASAERPVVLDADEGQQPHSAPSTKQQQPLRKQTLSNDFTPWFTSASNVNGWGTFGTENGTFQSSCVSAPQPTLQRASLLLGPHLPPLSQSFIPAASTIPRQTYMASSTLEEQHPPQSQRKLPPFQNQSLMLDPVIRSGVSPELAIEVDSDDDDEQKRGQQRQYSGPVVPSQRSMAEASRPLTRKQQKAASHAAAGQAANPPNPLSNKQRKHQKQLQLQKEVKQKRTQQHEANRKRKQEKRKQARENQQRQMPTAVGSWNNPMSNQVLKVHQSLFARAKDAMHVGGHSYAVVVQAMEQATAQLKVEASRHQSVHLPLPVLPASQPRQAPPTEVVDTAPVGVPKTPKTKFWKLPAKIVNAGLSALKHQLHHMETVDASDLDVNAANVSPVNMSMN